MNVEADGHLVICESIGELTLYPADGAAVVEAHAQLVAQLDAILPPLQQGGVKAGKRHLISCVEQDFLAILIAQGAPEPLGLDPTSAAGLARQQPEGKASDDTQVRRRMAGANAAVVLMEAHVQLPMQIVLDPPMAPDRFGELLG